MIDLAARCSKSCTANFVTTDGLRTDFWLCGTGGTRGSIGGPRISHGDIPVIFIGLRTDKSGLHGDFGRDKPRSAERPAGLQHEQCIPLFFGRSTCFINSVEKRRISPVFS